MNISTLFFGSGQFARQVLEKLLVSELVEVTAVVTQPDKPAGRKQELTPSPVKSLLAGNDRVKIFQPEKLSEVADQILAEVKPDLIIVADYGQILPESVINYPKYKCLNIHGSLLPKMRGAVPIQMTILQGLPEAGLSIAVMTPGLDDGPLLGSTTLALRGDETTASLVPQLAELGTDLLLKVLPGWVDGSLQATPQDESQVSFAKKTDFSKENAQIKLSYSAGQIDRMVRAYYPWPVAWAMLTINGQPKRLKIFSVKKIQPGTQSAPGTIIKSGKQLLLQLNDGVLELIEVQMEGKKSAKGEDYLFLAGSNMAE